MAVLAIALIGLAGAANYMYEKASVKGVGYKNVEMIVSSQTGFNGAKLVEKESGSGNVITEKTELEAERQIGSGCDDNHYIEGGDINPTTWNFFDTVLMADGQPESIQWTTSTSPRKPSLSICQ